MTKRKLVNIYNIVTGVKKTVAERLWLDYFKVKTKNGKKEWELAPIQKGDYKESNTETKEIPQINRISIDSIKTSLLSDKEFLSELKSIICACDEKVTSGNTCCNFNHEINENQTINPFDFVSSDELRTWLNSQGIYIPKTVKKLETLQTFIPEIYKKQ